MSLAMSSEYKDDPTNRSPHYACPDDDGEAP